MKPLAIDEIKALEPGSTVYLQSRYPHITDSLPCEIVETTDTYIALNTYSLRRYRFRYVLYNVNVKGMRVGWRLWPRRPSKKDREAVQWDVMTLNEYTAKLRAQNKQKAEEQTDEKAT